MILQFDPYLVYGQFSCTHFYAWLHTICNTAVPNIPVYQYKRNWPITCDRPESSSVLCVAFLILPGIFVYRDDSYDELEGYYATRATN